LRTDPVARALSRLDRLSLFQWVAVRKAATARQLGQPAAHDLAWQQALDAADGQMYMADDHTIFLSDEGFEQVRTHADRNATRAKSAMPDSAMRTTIAEILHMAHSTPGAG
jgi:hypothetical protein